jgi:signal transduction histidine kinase
LTNPSLETGIPSEKVVGESTGTVAPVTRSPQSFKFGVRLHLILLILVIFVPLLFIQIYSAFQEYETQRQQVLERQLETARSVARNVNALINDNDNNNRALGAIYSTQTRLSQQQGNNVLALYKARLPYLNSYQVLSPEGQIIYADPPNLVGGSFAESEAFQRLKVANPTVSPNYEVTNLRASPTDSRTPVFSILTALYGQNNQPVGFVIAEIDTTKLSPVLDIRLGVKNRGTLSIHDKNAALIYNSLFPTRPFEQRQSTSVSSVLEVLKGRESIVAYVVSPLDGLDKMGASAPIPGIGWSASVAEPIEDAMSPTVSLLVPRLLWFGLVAFVALVIAWFYARYISRPLVELRRAAADFGQGNLDRRTSEISTGNTISEVADLSTNFNNMAERLAIESRNRDAFLAQASHELKTPLTVIKGTSQLLLSRQRKAAANEDAPNAERDTLIRQLTKLEHQANRMGDLITRLLEHTRLQTGQLGFDFEILNFAVVIERCFEAAQLLASPDRYKLSLEIPFDKTTEGWIRADSARIEQVVMNLLENAVKYSPLGGAVSVRLEAKAADARLGVPYMLLSVQDTGVGIDAAELERIFERYYRVQTPLSAGKIAGLGLGLYISTEIVREHNGKLWAQSEGAKKGSIFYLALPSVVGTPESYTSAQVYVSDSLPGSPPDRKMVEDQ